MLVNNKDIFNNHNLNNIVRYKKVYSISSLLVKTKRHGICELFFFINLFNTFVFVNALKISVHGKFVY